MAVMKFTNTRMAVVLIVAWASVLSVIDYFANPRPLAEFFWPSYHPLERPNITTPHIRLWMNHMCCSGCFDDVNAALKGLPWVDKVIESGLPEQEKAGAEASQGVSLNYANQLDVLIKPESINMVDFQALDNALRGVGLTAQRIEFGGVGHYRLEVGLHHICCNACNKALDEGIKKALKAQGITWIDSVKVEKPSKTVVVYARLQGDKDLVDVQKFIRGLGDLGFAPHAVRVRTDNEQKAVVLTGDKGERPEGKPEMKPEMKPEAAPETKPEAKPETKPEAKPETRPEARPETKKAEEPKAEKGASIGDGLIKLPKPIHFMKGSDELTTESMATVHSLGKSVKGDPGVVEIMMTVKASGDKKAAKEIAGYRVTTLKEALEKAGVPRKVLKIKASHDPGPDEIDEIMVRRTK